MATKQTHSKRTVVGVSMSPADLAVLDAQTAQLGSPSRATALKQLWQHMGDVAAQRHQVVTAADAAGAESVEPLIDALHEASQAWHQRAHQRRAIGVHSNQIAKLANVLSAAVTRGDLSEITSEQIDTITLALQGIERRLIEQSAAESEDDAVLAAVRERISTRSADLA